MHLTATQVVVDPAIVSKVARLLTVRLMAVRVLTGAIHKRIFAGATMRARLSRLLLLLLLFLQHPTKGIVKLVNLNEGFECNRWATLILKFFQ